MKISFRKGLIVATWLPILLGAAVAHGAASDYPKRPVRVIVPFPPGGSDVAARMLAEKLYERFRQPFVVDNRPGAAGMLGTTLAARANPDGYTLLFATASFPVTAVYYKNVQYDALNDFTAVSALGSVPFMLVVNPSVPVHSAAEFIKLAKAKPGELNYGTPGTGSIGHLATVLFVRQTGITVTHIPYKGTGPAVAALLKGEIQFMLPNLIGGLSHVRAGRLRSLGIASTKRSKLAPEIPTLSEAGVQGFTGGTWYGMLAPRGTPRAIVTRLNKEIEGLLGTKEFQEMLATRGVEIDTDMNTPEEFWKFIQSEMAQWKKLIEDAGIERQ